MIQKSSTGRAHVTLSELVPKEANQRSHAVRAPAAGRHLPREAAATAVPDCPPRLRPAAPGHPCPAGAPDPAHRSGPVFGGLKFLVARASRRACRSDSSVSAIIAFGQRIGCHIWTELR